MHVIFVNVKCQLGRAYDVAGELIDQELAAEVYSVSGAYDLMAKCYIPKDQDIGHFVVNKIQVLEGIVDTSTIITFKAF